MTAYRTGHMPLRVMGVAYPTPMFISVVVTGNHYVVDPIVGGLVVYVSVRIPVLMGRCEEP